MMKHRPEDPTVKRFRFHGPHGPRGVMLLGFSGVALTLGLTYIIEPAGRILGWLDDVIPLDTFGTLWVLTGLWLLFAAFSVRQSRALAAMAGMSTLWGTAYLWATIINLANGEPPAGYSLTVIFYCLALACGAAVRMANPAPTHLEVIRKPGLPPDPKIGGQHG